MERSGTLSEPFDNSTKPYIKKRPTLLGQPPVQVFVRWFVYRRVDFFSISNFDHDFPLGIVLIKP